MNHFRLICSFLAAFFIFLLTTLWGISETMLQEAHASYQQGEKAKTYEERKFAFNRALFLYHSLKETELDTADLDQAIGDTYFQLGKYPWAILYYQKALKKDSHLSLALSHLEEANKKLGLPSSFPTPQQEWIKPFVFLSKQFQLFFWIILITFLLFSCVIWFPLSWIRLLAMSCVFLLLLWIGNFLFFYYFTPVEGILVKTTGFYRAPDWNQPQLTKQPLLAGSKLQILQMTTDEKWLKVENSARMIGYIPTHYLRPI